jgi:type II secretory pathway component PulF
MSLIVTPGQLKRRAELYHQLGAMLSAGIPLLKALEMTSVNPAVRASRATILQLIQYMNGGLTFSDSMSRVQGWMPEFDIALLSVGEQSGRLDSSFKLLSEYYDTRSRIIRDTISDLMVTMATLHVFLLVFPLGFLISFAQGIMNNNYSQCIPFLLEKLVAFGSLYTFIFLLAFAGQGERGQAWRSVMEGTFAMVPVLRTAQKYLVLSRLTAAMEALVSAGVSIISGWELAAAASGSPRLQRIVAGWKSHFASGTTPSELISRTDYFPEMFANLYNTGEVSGQLDTTLDRLQAYYREEGFRTLRVFTRILNGIIYGSVAAMIGYYVITFWKDYYGNLLNGANF